MANEASGMGLPLWGVWAIVVIGFLSLGLGFWMGRSRLGRRRSAPGLEPTAEPRVATPQGAANGKWVGRGPERRHLPRYESRPMRLWIATADHPTEPFEGTVLNHSLGGFCVWMERDLPLQAVIYVRAVGAPYAVSHVQAVIRNVRKLRGGWAIGCQFLGGSSAGSQLFG